MKVNNTSEINNTFLKILVFAPSGAGKTSLAKSVTNPKKILVISAESGLLSLAGSGIDYIDITILLPRWAIARLVAVSRANGVSNDVIIEDLIADHLEEPND